MEGEEVDRNGNSLVFHMTFFEGYREMRLMLGQLYLRQYAAPSAIKELERALELGVSKKEVATLALAHAYFRANAYAGLTEMTISLWPKWPRGNRRKQEMLTCK